MIIRGRVIDRHLLEQKQSARAWNPHSIYSFWCEHNTSQFRTFGWIKLLTPGEILHLSYKHLRSACDSGSILSVTGWVPQRPEKGSTSVPRCDYCEKCPRTSDQQQTASKRTANQHTGSNESRHPFRSGGILERTLTWCKLIPVWCRTTFRDSFVGLLQPFSACFITHSEPQWCRTPFDER